MFFTTTINKIKQDSILKNFWRDNARFADLFNTALFGGVPFLHPDDLRKADTDVSSLLKFNGHAETIQKVFDVVKKTANGVNFVIWGLENQLIAKREAVELLFLLVTFIHLCQVSLFYQVCFTDNFNLIDTIIFK